MPRLWSWSFVCICFCLLLGEARGGVLDVQDDNPALVYSGQWFPDASPNAHGKHETWTNASGASVRYDFQGSQVEVFATQRPTGTYLTNVSFQIDDDVPDFWTTNANVTQETFNKLVYTSPGTLSADGSHRITITNYGFVFWLVYLEITTPDVSGGSNTTSTSTATGTGTQTSTSSAGTSSATPHPNTSSGSASRTPVIIGAVVGSVGGAALLLLAALWVWCVHYSRSRKRALSPTPFAGQADPSAHRPAKDRPPPNAPSRFRRWIAPRSQAAASEPDYGYGHPSTGARGNAPQARGRAADAEALKQLAVFRSAAEARAAPAPPPPPLRGPPAASIPTTLETPTASPSPSPRSAAPGSRSRAGALARAFTFSSGLERDPVRARAPPTETEATTMGSALASSGVLPPASPSPYTPPDRDRRGPVFFRVLRRSRDGGVRLAGGPPQERGADADMMAPEEYDERMLEAMGASASEGSTLPPEYQYRQYPAGGGPGGGGRGRG